jgi:transaldolase/glucose-6-phosphate isomerase
VCRSRVCRPRAWWHGPGMTPMQRASELGHSIWLDNLRRSMFSTGELAQMIDEGLRGMTSNPTIFEKAIAAGGEYDDAIAALVADNPDLDDVTLFEHLAIGDIQRACDAFHDTYERTDHRDGLVSLEVSPLLANDTHGTIAEARRLHEAVARPNVMIKVPGTKAGIPAIRHLIAEGINVNTTLLFGIDAYLAAADAYLAGLELRRASGLDITGIAGVASFFLSRIDTAVDKQLEAHPGLDALRGRTAIANAKVAYMRYRELIASSRWKTLAEAGARSQRLLWASTSTKNPAYPKLMYVEALIGRDTVDTVPTETYAELRARGDGIIRETLPQDLDSARRTLARLAEAGISLDHITDRLLVDGVALFAASYESAVRAVGGNRARVAPPKSRREVTAGAVR